jgi:hypothetical protein
MYLSKKTMTSHNKAKTVPIAPIRLINAFSQVVTMVSNMRGYGWLTNANSVSIGRITGRDMANANLVIPIVIIIVITGRWSWPTLTMRPSLFNPIVKVKLIDLLLLAVLTDPSEYLGFGISCTIISATGVTIARMDSITSVGTTSYRWTNVSLTTACQ